MFDQELIGLSFAAYNLVIKFNAMMVSIGVEYCRHNILGQYNFYHLWF